MTAWASLLLAGVVEIAWAYGLKHTDGLTRVWPTVGTAAAIVLSFALVAFALKSIVRATDANL